MTNPISSYARISPGDLGARREAERAERQAVDAPVADTATDRTGLRPAGMPMDDELMLSETARQATGSEAFDQAKVDAIKQAIQDGNYPLDSRRIAESFEALERLL
jgi:negative regulator of flagellin synthesis FlgM